MAFSIELGPFQEWAILLFSGMLIKPLSHANHNINQQTRKKE
jgi:hypothetical protein